MIFGTGIDIEEIERIQESVEKYGDHFLNKVYTKTELEYCLPKKNKYHHLAARFAAKEAIAKALSAGWEEGFNWKDIEIINEKNGKPIVNLYGKLKEFVSEDKGLQISMSHSRNYVTCFAILYTNI